MKPVFIVLAALVALATPSPGVDQDLKSEIELAATESRHLADELSGMLSRLEIQEDRDTAVDAAVRGEQEEVEAALKEMVEKIENLAKASEETSTETVSGLVKRKRVKERELRKTLEQLELVAAQIEEAAGSADSVEEVNSIENIAKLLQSISDKVETGNKEDGEEEDEEVFRRQFGKEQSKTGLELNGIAEMIKSLEKVTEDIKEDEDDNADDADDAEYKDEDEDEETPSSRRLAQLVDDFKNGKQEPRGGKQVDLEEDAEYVDDESSLESTASKLLDVLDLDDTEEESRSSDDTEEESRSSETSKKTYEKPRQEKAKKSEPKEECEGKTAEDKVRVCLPKPKTKRSPVKLPSGKIHEEPVCLDISRTVCNESSAVLSREVCTYSYQQQEVLAPAQSVELTFQPRVEKIGVTRCHVVTEKHGYKQVDVEKCVMEYIDSPYILPDLAINVDDFLQLQLPEPEKR